MWYESNMDNLWRFPPLVYGDPSSRGETVLKASVGSLVESVALKGTLREALRDGLKPEHYNLLFGTAQGGPDEMPGDGSLWRIMGTTAPSLPNVPDGPTWEELLRIVSRIVGTKAATGGAYEGSPEDLWQRRRQAVHAAEQGR